MKRHPRIVDSAAALPLFIGSVLMASKLAPPEYMPTAIAVPLAFGLCAPVVIRRRFPAVAFALAAVVAFVQWLFDGYFTPADLVLFAALYNVASRRGRVLAVTAAATVELGACLAIQRWWVPEIGTNAWTNMAPVTVLVVAVWIWGSSVRARRTYLAGLEERAVRAERERDSQAQIAAAAERARIAREMHDVVAHSLSVMVVQADGAGYALDTDTERARQALETVSSTGRTALTETRRLLGLLRAEDREQEYAPQPGMAQLTELVGHVRQAGLPVEFAVEGVPRELAEGMQLAAYRLVQEALTNTLKHGGPSVTTAHVRLRYTDDELVMRVSDDGRGAAAPLGQLADRLRPGGHNGQNGDGQVHGGHGLVGMRERMAIYGGTVRAGPKQGGGYEVVASLPFDPSHSPAQSDSSDQSRRFT